MSEEQVVANEVVEEEVVEPVETVETEEAEVVEKTPEEAKAERKASKKSGFEKRVQKLNDKASEARKEADYWRNEAQKNQVKPAEQVRAQQVQEVKPTMSQFSNMEDYTEALTDYKLNQREAASKVTSSQTKVLDGYNAKAAEFSKTKADFSEVLAAADDVVCAAEIHQACLDSDVGPQMAYYLAKNQDEIERINNLSPHRRLIELGKLEDKLISKAAPKEKKVAPAPTSAVKGGTSVASLAEKSVYELTPQELMRKRNADDQKRRTGR